MKAKADSIVWPLKALECLQQVCNFPEYPRITSWLWLEGTSRSPSPAPPRANGSYPGGFEYLQRRRLHSLSGQPVSVLSQPHRKVYPFPAESFHTIDVIPEASHFPLDCVIDL